MKRIDYTLIGKKYVAVPSGRGCSGYSPCWHTFTTLVNGKYKHYLIDGEEVTQKEGNQRWLDLKSKLKDVQVDKTESETTYEAEIKKLDELMDKYAHFIDDYSIYAKVCDRNEKIQEQMSKLKSWKQAESV